MAEKKSLFRQSSLERFVSPEQLDQRLTVVPPIGWMALIALAGLLAAACVWGIFGSIPEKVYGTGVLLYGDGIAGIVSQTGGRVTDLSVREGDYVEKGQVIARVEQEELINGIAACRREIAELEAAGQQEAESSNLQERRMELESLLFQLARRDVIRAGYSGRILDLHLQRDDFVAEGDVVGSLIRDTKAKENTAVVLYLPIEQGKRVQEGMAVNVSPSTVNREEYGYISGRVKSVSEYAVTRESMLNTLRNEQMVHAFAGEDAVMEVRVELLRSAATVSGYRWSTEEGAPTTIAAGTICEGEIRVASRRPVDLVLPFLRGLFG